MSGGPRVSLACGNTEVTGGHLSRVVSVALGGGSGGEIGGREPKGAGSRDYHGSNSLFCSGIFGERLPLRYYLTAGMLLSGLFTSLLGLGYFWNIHALWYFVLIQVRAFALHSGLCSRHRKVVEAAGPTQPPQVPGASSPVLLYHDAGSHCPLPVVSLVGSVSLR